MINADTAAINHFQAELDAVTSASGAGPGLAGISRSWAVLRHQLLPLENVPARDCPSCGKTGFAAATRCGFCWTELTPVVQAHAAR